MQTLMGEDDDYVAVHRDKRVHSQWATRYLSALQYVDAVVGNSSSGLIEAPSFKIGTINIGERQKGRIKADSVIDCLPEKEAISEALQKIYASSFQARLLNVVNPYDGGGTSASIFETLRSMPLNNILKKRFHDLPSTLNA
jgi:GDP/UDP-N,N'-diacetylbacillosamine 2-epimerase (hydrolysing)